MYNKNLAFVGANSISLWSLVKIAKDFNVYIVLTIIPLSNNNCLVPCLS